MAASFCLLALLTQQLLPLARGIALQQQGETWSIAVTPGAAAEVAGGSLLEPPPERWGPDEEAAARLREEHSQQSPPHQRLMRRDEAAAGDTWQASEVGSMAAFARRSIVAKQTPTTAQPTPAATTAGAAAGSSTAAAGSTTTTTTMSTLVVGHGVVVANTAKDDSEEIKLEEKNFECMVDTPMEECYRRTGSYGIRKLKTETWEDIVNLGYARPNWMAHPNVQRQRLYNLTLPGTHGSGTYNIAANPQMVGTGLAWGIQTQDLSVDGQLELGIRAFDLRVAWSYSANKLFVANGVLTVPLEDVLSQMATFLSARPKEVIIVSAGIAPPAAGLEDRNRMPLLSEVNSATRLPGELMHELMFKVFGRMLATFATLSRLPMTEDLQNPMISNLVQTNARVIYYWEGQQVLCLSRAECDKTPGFTQPWSGLAFGWGMPMGARVAQGGLWKNAIEPSCLAESFLQTASAHPDWVVKNIQKWSADLQGALLQNVPTCFPTNSLPPGPKSPQLFYWANAYVSYDEPTKQAIAAAIGPVTGLFTQGEPLTVRTTAERMNYLLLAWYMNKRPQNATFMKPNVIAMDFPTPILVQRIVEANQFRAECGWTVTCQVTGSCWAISQARPEDDTLCYTATQATALVEDHAAEKSKVKTALLITTLVVLNVFLVVLVVFFYLRRKRTLREGKAPFKEAPEQDETQEPTEPQKKISMASGDKM